MKPKIGLFLSALPQFGGAFQFSGSVLEAICAFPSDRYDRVAVFTEDVGPTSCPRAPFRGLRCAPPFCQDRLPTSASQAGFL